MPMRERGKGDARGGEKRERERRDPLQRKEQMLHLGGGREYGAVGRAVSVRKPVCIVCILLSYYAYRVYDSYTTSIICIVFTTKQ